MTDKRLPTVTWPWPSGPFFLGANLPWIDYGCDFGASAWFPDGGLASRADARGRFIRALSRLASDGVAVVRQFVFCDGRSGVKAGAGGEPIGLDDRVTDDLDTALDIAGDAGIRLILVLFDFHLCRPARVVNGLQIGGRASWIADPALTGRLLATVVQPIAERYGSHPVVAAWDLYNEPEWCTRPFAAASRRDHLPFDRTRTVLEDLVRTVRAHAQQPVTVGSASARHLDLVRGIGLDFYQVHWYEPFGWSALASPVSGLDLGRPAILGEFPGRGAAVTPEAIAEAARRAGYAGALIWSALSRDDDSGYVDGRPLAD